MRLSGKVKWGPAIVIRQINLRARGQQSLRFRKVAFTRSVMQFGATVAINPRSFFSLRLFATHPLVSGLYNREL
jgi:hypothetical protein